MSFLQRRGAVTDIKAPPGVWPTPKGWLSPYLAMGPGATQNLYGNLHAQTGAITATATTGTMAFSDLGDTFTGKRVVINGTVSGSTLTVNSIISGSISDIAAGMAVLYDVWQANGSASVGVIVSGSGPYTLSSSPGNATSVQITLVERYLGIDGQSAFSRIANPDEAAHLCWQHRVTYDDLRPSGQSAGSGVRKVLARFGDSGLEASNGLGIIQTYNTYYMDMFALRIPQATRDIIRYGDSMLLWQHKNSTNEPGLALFQWSGDYVGSANQDGAPQISSAPVNEPRLVVRLWNGDTNGNYLALANYSADTWIYVLMRVKPNKSDGNAQTQCWIASGSGSATKIMDTTRGNCDAAGVDVNRQWGWYLFNNSSYCNSNGVNKYPALAPWWASGNSLTMQVKDYLVAPQEIANIDPPLWLVNSWFNTLRGR